MASMKLINVGGETSKVQESCLVLKMLYAAHTSELPAEISSSWNTSGLHSSTSTSINCILSIEMPRPHKLHVKMYIHNAHACTCIMLGSQYMYMYIIAESIRMQF